LDLLQTFAHNSPGWAVAFTHILAVDEHALLMIEGWTVVALALGYVSILFAVAWYADRTSRARKAGQGRPLIYALSLAVYCTSWTFFGSVGLAASTGYNFLPVYLGPILFFALGSRLLMRIVKLAKSQNITSVADFLPRATAKAKRLPPSSRSSPWPAQYPTSPCS
jgi:MFS family permease